MLFRSTIGEDFGAWSAITLDAIPATERSSPLAWAVRPCASRSTIAPHVCAASRCGVLRKVRLAMVVISIWFPWLDLPWPTLQTVFGELTHANPFRITRHGYVSLVLSVDWSALQRYQSKSRHRSQSIRCRVLTRTHHFERLSNLHVAGWITSEARLSASLVAI